MEKNVKLLKISALTSCNVKCDFYGFTFLLWIVFLADKRIGYSHLCLESILLIPCWHNFQFKKNLNLYFALKLQSLFLCVNNFFDTSPEFNQIWATASQPIVI